MFVWDVSPVAFSLFGIEIYWYGIIFAIAIICVWKFASYIRKSVDGKIQGVISKQDFEKLVINMVIAMIIGGRLGHVFFFEPSYYLANPLEILMIRNGGMAFHGGAVAVLLVIIFTCKKVKANFKVLLDIFTFAASIGIAIGRLANFVNSELYGKIMNSDISVIFANVDPFPRVPTQLFESAFEGVATFLVMTCVWLFAKKEYIGSGLYTFIFCLMYSAFRFVIEFFKDVENFDFLGVNLTMGQILCVFLLVAGVIVKFYKKTKLTL